LSRIDEAIRRELRMAVGDAPILDRVPSHYLRDETEARGLNGEADAVALPATAEEAQTIVAWCYGHDVPIIPRGGGTGFSGGAVPIGGGVVLSTERLRAVRSFDPLLWRMNVEAGRTTAEVRQLARESGLLFPPDPGGGEQSQIGGNIATNAGGPHAFKYGVTGHWITGLEVIVAPGELISLGGAQRKDVAGYDLISLLVGSEGTLGLITAAWLRLMPAPASSAPVVAFYTEIDSGCEAIERVLGYGIPVAALEYLDPTTVELATAGFRADAPPGSFMVIAEVDGSAEEVVYRREELIGALQEDALSIYAPLEGAEIAALWQWREGVSLVVQAVRGGKVSEDIAVPVDRLGQAIKRTLEIGQIFGLRACSWGHAGDGNLHSTFMIDPASSEDVQAATEAARALFAVAIDLGGTVSGEHGVGLVKGGQLARQWQPAGLRLHERVKHALDPKGLFNPGKKLARP
jgi:glycolate oxidase subunit GlcD